MGAQLQDLPQEVQQQFLMLACSAAGTCCSTQLTTHAWYCSYMQSRHMPAWTERTRSAPACRDNIHPPKCVQASVSSSAGALSSQASALRQLEMWSHLVSSHVPGSQKHKWHSARGGGPHPVAVPAHGAPSAHGPASSDPLARSVFVQPFITVQSAGGARQWHRGPAMAAAPG